ncbi:MAG: hypothetical protein KAS49_05895, partial [Candidatus Cloacimonetes bacterium]|nr:hypothetical protein [Candidatus Cloacimonadota bacterium]
MKKLVVLLLVIALAGSLFAYNDLMVQAEKKVTNNGDVLKRQTREIPEYEFEVGLTDMATTFYDYMPGSYCSSPLRILSDGSAYAAFHGQETDSSKRRVFYSYITADGNVSTSKIGTDNIFEGYAGIAVDPETNNPFVAWHAEATAGYEVVFTYDMYQAYGPGYWKKPFVIIDSKTPSPLADDEFLWPYTYIGPSPVDGKRRVYVTANNNNKINTGPSGNVLLAYADFDGNDVIDQSELDWTYTTVPKFDEWHAATEWIRPFKTMAVSEFDGRIAYMGYNTDEEAFVIYNDNYGEGDWTYKSEPLNISVTNPLKQDGTPQFVLDNDVPAKISFSHQNDGHFNAVFMEGGSKLWTPGALGLRGEENAEGKTVIWPYYIFPKAFNYDFTTDEFSFVDLDITGSPEGAATDGKPMLPWDLDEDGAVDEYYD